MSGPYPFGEPTGHLRRDLLRHHDSNESPDWMFGWLGGPPSGLRFDQPRQDGVFGREQSFGDRKGHFDFAGDVRISTSPRSLKRSVNPGM
jgi:hypothetical protein